MSKPWDKNPTKRPVKHFSRRVSISMLYAKNLQKLASIAISVIAHLYQVMESKACQRYHKVHQGLSRNTKLPFFIALNDLMPWHKNLSFFHKSAHFASLF